MGRSRIALLRKGELPVLPGEEREEGRGGKVGTGGEPAFFSGAFKTYTIPWESRPQRFPPNKELSGEGHGWFPAR
jgi:hypothetical protein